MPESDEAIIKDLEKAIEEGRELENAHPIPVRKSRKLTVTFAVRLSSEEQRDFSRAAEARGMSLADFMRNATRAAASGELDISAAQNIDKARKAARELSDALSHL